MARSESVAGRAGSQADRIGALHHDSRCRPDRDGVGAGNVGDDVDLFLAGIPNLVVEVRNRPFVRPASLGNDVDAMLIDDHTRILARAECHRVAMLGAAFQMTLDGTVRFERGDVLLLCGQRQSGPNDPDQTDGRKRGPDSHKALPHRGMISKA